MSEHLTKGQAALKDAAEHMPDYLEDGANVGPARGTELHFSTLLKIANVQAQMAQAEQLERIANALERVTP